MKFTYNWLKDYVSIKVGPEKLAEILTMSGLEVKALTKKADDYIFDCEVTPNRPDLLSLVGIAREVCALTGGHIKTSLNKIKSNIKEKNGFQVLVKDKTACPRYMAVVVKDVCVGGSPAWLKKRIEAIGLRSVNNIVDITNYSLWELGQPIHAFDLDKLNKQIIVRFANPGEKITIIDGKTMELDARTLLICDNANPVAIAGIMGGKETEVKKETKNLLLEFACFDPKIIRRATRNLGLSSDSSYRFERGVDLEVLPFAAKRTLDLIKNVSKDCCVKQVTDLGTKTGYKKTIILEPDKLNNVLGVSITDSKISRILKSLGLKLAKLENSFSVKIPSFRPDLSIEEDLFEEVARIHGYSNIKNTQPYIKFNSVKDDPAENIKRIAKQSLLREGFFEAITYSLLSAALAEELGFANTESLELLNPLSQEASVLRPSLLPGLLQVVKNNIARQNKDLKIFEIGNIFNKDKETARLAFVATGIDYSAVNSRVNVCVETSTLHLKGVMENIFSSLGIEDVEFLPCHEKLFHRGESFIAKNKSTTLAIIGKVEKCALESMEIKSQDVFACEIYLDSVKKIAKLLSGFKPYSQYPFVVRDISLLVEDKVVFKQIISTIKDLNILSIEEIKLADYYKGKHIPKGFKGLTVSIKYRSDQHTLTDSDINSMHDNIKQALKTKLEATFR